MVGMPYPPNLCASVSICGRYFSARMFCVFSVFCGNSLPVCLFMSVVVFSHGFHGFPQMVRLRYWLRGYGRMPYPPNLCASVSICWSFRRRVWHPVIPTPPFEVLPQNSPNSQKFLAEDFLPRISQILTDF